MCGRVGRPVGACVTDVCTHFFFCRTSSVKFGNSSDSTRASDPQLRVLGISNLRIGDGSAYPAVDSHLQASGMILLVYMCECVR